MNPRLSRPLRVLFVAVLANYLAQIPYALHLYGFAVNPRGVALLGLTLVWFLAGFWLLISRHVLGYWITLAFLIVQVLFYFNNEILRMFDGYGLIYHLTQFRDPIIWAVELVGDINWIVAAYALVYLAKNRRALVGDGRQGVAAGSTLAR